MQSKVTFHDHDTDAHRETSPETLKQPYAKPTVVRLGDLVSITRANIQGTQFDAFGDFEFPMS